MRHLIIHKSDNPISQFIRYLFAGGSAFIVDFGALYILTEFFGIYYLVSGILSFILGILTNYIISIKWVFSKRKYNKTKERSYFLLIGITGLLLSGIFIWIFTDILAIYYLVSKIITTLIVFLWNFFAKKLILFN